MGEFSVSDRHLNATTELHRSSDRSRVRLQSVEVYYAVSALRLGLIILPRSDGTRPTSRNSSNSR